MVCDAAGAPLGCVLTAGQRHESKAALDALLSVPLDGRMAKKLLGDKGYSSARMRLLCRLLGCKPVIPYRKDELERMPKKPRFDKKAYRGRNVVERLIGRLKEYRRIATRFEKLAVNFLSMIHIASIRFFLNT